MQAARGTSIVANGDSAATGHRWRLLFAVVALGGLAIDVITKLVAVARLDPNRPVELLGGLLTLRLIRNPGAAFSVGTNFTIVFALLSVAVLAFVLVRLAPRLGHPGWAVALGLLCAGVSGNLSDRIFRAPGALRGHVVDFLQLPHWPIFNVADICIDTAAVLIVVLSIIKNVGIDGVRHARSRPTAEGAAGADPEPTPDLEPERARPADPSS